MGEAWKSFIPFIFLAVVDVLSRMVALGVDKDLIESFRVGWKIVHLSPQFSDEYDTITIFFCLDKKDSFGNLNSTMTVFEIISGVKINSDKILFVILRVSSLSLRGGLS